MVAIAITKTVLNNDANVCVYTWYHTWLSLPNQISAPRGETREGERIGSFILWVIVGLFLRYGRAPQKTSNWPFHRRPNSEHRSEQAVRSPAMWSWNGGAYGWVHTSHHYEKLPVSFRFLNVRGQLTSSTFFCYVFFLPVMFRLHFPGNELDWCDLWQTNGYILYSQN